MIVIDQERRMVMARGTRYSQEFKEDAVRYRLEHPEIALRKCAENLGISELNNPVPVSLLSGDRGSSAIIRYYCYIPCTSTLLQATACHIFHTLYVLSFLICY